VRVRKGKWALAVFTVAVLIVGTMVASPAGYASPRDEYTHAHFGRDIPPGCKRDSMRTGVMSNVCHHMRTDLNGLDSPVIDVLIAVPVSPFAERESRIMRQAVEMWRGGIEYLAPQMGLEWLGRGVKFRITVDTVDPTSDRFTFLPVIDPEIVVIATNPVGGAGIGIDPIWEAGFVSDEVLSPFLGRDLPIPGDAPCNAYQSWLFDFGFWDSLPGFDSHHAGRSGTYTEDCGGSGGNVCFAINAAMEPTPKQTNRSSLFDLVAHEFGHCLSLGHVGDGAEGSWGTVPKNAIMAYDHAPAGLTKCVSTLDVEVFATRMSKYLDVNGDRLVNSRDLLSVNDPEGDILNPFQTQHPRDHLYASRSGEPRDCPQPALGVVPGPRTDWTPEPAATAQRVITLASPRDGSRSSDPSVAVSGEVRKTGPRANTPSPTVAPKPVAKSTTATPRTVTFKHAGGNTFHTEDTALGTGRGRHTFGLDVTEPSDIEFKLTWTGGGGLSDLDLYVTGAADSGSSGAGGAQPEIVSFRAVQGRFDVAVEPYLVMGGPGGVTYTLTAAIKPNVSNPDRDGDDTPDERDVCIDRAGTGADGCPMQATERVLAYIDDSTKPAAAQDVDTAYGSDGFAFSVPMPKGTHSLKVVWASTKGMVFATHTVHVTRP
jgi:hypothetical protein